MADILGLAKTYTDEAIAAHAANTNAHPQYVQLVTRLGADAGGDLIILFPGQSFPPVKANSVLFAPDGIYLSNEAGTAWVKLGAGPIPADTIPPTVPSNLRVTATTTTSLALAWNASTDTDTGLAGYEVSIDGGAFVFLGDVLSYTFINLQPASTHSMRVRARDKANTPNVSAAATLSAATDPLPLTAPSNLRTTGTTTTSLTFAWNAPSSGTVVRYETRVGAGTFSSVGMALTQQVTGLTQNTFYTFGVRAVDSGGAVSAETTLSARTSSTTVTPVTTLLGVSTTSTSNHGNLTWDGWRAYNLSALNNDAAKTPKPKFIAYSESATNLGGSSVNYTTIFNHCRSALDTFYYGGTGQTHTAKWGIKLYWSNGNENYTKGIITTKTQANIDAYVQSQKALYDAVHYVDPTTGSRRYPDAFAGSNPTTYQEQSGVVQTALHAAARYHDFVMWSMYPLNLGDDGQDIVFNWPSFKESDRTNAALGFLIRCFYRTKQAEAQARIDRGDPTFRLSIACGETGATRDPNDTTTRPYWTTHAMWGGAMKLAAQYDLDMPFLCWWDDDVAGRATSFSYDTTTANPSSAKAWHDAALYNHEFGGTHPASWAGTPKSSWNTTGPVV